MSFLDYIMLSVLVLCLVPLVLVFFNSRERNQRNVYIKRTIERAGKERAGEFDWSNQ